MEERDLHQDTSGHVDSRSIFQLEIDCVTVERVMQDVDFCPTSGFRSS
jgi:hypothetical protein